MADKVICEVKFIETDDGFRVAFKGDKERMREMGFGPGMHFGKHAHQHGLHSWGRKFRKGFGPGFGFGPGWDEKSEPHRNPPSTA